MFAVSRTCLDNFNHITACWAGLASHGRMASVALCGGADDLWRDHRVPRAGFHLAGATSPQLPTKRGS
jgi:hypothetical protein